MTWLVVGLGNPGPAYATTRHNVGQLVAEVLAGRMAGRFRAHPRGRAEVVEGRLAGERVVLARPRSYMNDSGGPVASLLAYYDAEPGRLVVVHDELDVAFGALRVKLGGGDNGHNGLRSIRQASGTGDFYRVRVGIGRPAGRMTVHDYVLSSYGAAERKELPVQLEEAADAIESLLARGLEATQNEVHR